MGKERSPEEVAARKAKKEGKKAAVRAARGDGQAGVEAAPKVACSAEVISDVKRKLQEAVGVGPGNYVSLTDRMNPMRASFDEALRSAWKIMPKAEKARWVKQDGVLKKERRRQLEKRIDYPFIANPDDHCETSPEAYLDLVPLLELLAKKLGKSAEDLAIYDPYFCAGSVKNHLGALGFKNVYNECEDFYKVQEDDAVPEHDVVVTNPPYAEAPDGGSTHIERLLKFCTHRGTPFMLNMPEYVTAAGYYKRRFEKRPPAPLLLCPYKRYSFWSPMGLRPDANQKGHRNPELGFRTNYHVCQWYVSLEPSASHDKLLRMASRGKLADIDVAPEASETTEELLHPAGSADAAVRCRLCRDLSELPPLRHLFNAVQKSAADGNSLSDDEQESQEAVHDTLTAVDNNAAAAQGQHEATAEHSGSSERHRKRKLSGGDVPPNCHCDEVASSSAKKRKKAASRGETSADKDSGEVLERRKTSKKKRLQKKDGAHGA